MWLTAPRLPTHLKTACWRSTAAVFTSKVGILLTDRTGTPLSLDERLDPQHDPRIEIPVDGGSGTFRLNAFYYTWDKTHADPGDGNATARFTIMQE